MGFGVLIVGDELLNGRRQDRHFAAAIERFAARGLTLSWARYVGDEPAHIETELRRTLATDDVVLCFGGIGATPDDHTRASAARAAGVALELHPQAVAEIEARFGADAYPLRIRMAELPRGSRIIPNPYNRVPGFSLAEHHFLPGFPCMAWPMMEWVLDHYYQDRFPAERPCTRAVRVWDCPETNLIPLLETLLQRHSGVRVSSLPSLDAARVRIELALTGPDAAVVPAMAELQQALQRMAIAWEVAPPDGDQDARPTVST